MPFPVKQGSCENGRRITRQASRPRPSLLIFYRFTDGAKENSVSGRRILTGPVYLLHWRRAEARFSGREFPGIRGNEHHDSRDRAGPPFGKQAQGKQAAPTLKTAGKTWICI
jgi:hypothetical protein